jgi:hypothetical protein
VVISPSRWSAPGTIERIYALAPELIRWRPGWMLGGLLVAGAALHQGAGARGAAAKLAERVLAWSRPHLATLQNLPAQIAILADLLAAKRAAIAAAAILFDHIAATGALSAPQWGNAVYAVLAANNQSAGGPELQARVVKAALANASDDPTVRFNVACVLAERGELDEARAHLLAALTLGAPPEHVAKERTLRALRDDPRVLQAMKKKPLRGKPPATRSFIRHEKPRLR